MGQSDLALGRRTVLVVDDHPGIREALGLILEDTYDLLFADDGPPALQLLTEKRVDAILLDLGLRDMDGFEVLAKIRSIAPRVPVIILTVRDTAADAVRALKLGARDYMTKPFDENTVHMRLSESLAAPADVQATHDDHGGGELRTRPVLAGSGAYIRPRCVVVAGHVGTAGALRVMLDRYIPTNSSTDCFHAAKILGIAPPECVVLDERAWELDGPSFVRILRLRSPAAHILLLSDDVRVTAQPSARVQFGVTRHHRLGDVIRHVLEGLMVTGVAVAGMALSDHVLAAVDFMRTHFDEELGAEVVARAAAISRGYLAERFRVELGTTVSGLVTTLRVEIARLLLVERKAPLGEVAMIAGFGDASHMSRVFQDRSRGALSELP